jgi:hypothetical protein
MWLALFVGILLAGVAVGLAVVLVWAMLMEGLDRDD